METITDHSDHPLINSLRFKLISRISIGATIAASVLLVVAMLFLHNEEGIGYAQLIQSQSITQKNLGPALVVAGLFLTLCVGIISWLLALYGSFRVAGPLFRFSRNLEQASTPSKLIGIRQGDCFQDVSEQLLDSANQFHQHYRDIGTLLDQLTEAAENDAADKERMQEIIQQLEECVGRVRVE